MEAKKCCANHCDCPNPCYIGQLLHRLIKYGFVKELVTILRIRNQLIDELEERK